MPMSTIMRAREPKALGLVPRLLTVADLAVMPDELPSGPVKYELDNGKLVIMPPPGDIHGAVQLNIGAELKHQGERRGHGKARSEVGVILWRNPDRVVGADDLFVEKSQLPLRLSKEGYLETLPDLAVEVRSKNDTRPAVRQKVRDYLKAGVRVVWVADPDKKTVTEYRRGKKPKVFKMGQVLTLEDIIPGFHMPIADVFNI
jgi:Uma2 family endonuclease